MAVPAARVADGQAAEAKVGVALAGTLADTSGWATSIDPIC